MARLFVPISSITLIGVVQIALATLSLNAGTIGQWGRPILIVGMVSNTLIIALVVSHKGAWSASK